MTTPAQTRLRRLRLRAWRRGIKEMDLILGPFADARLAELTPAALDDFERVLEQNDQDLYRWVSGQDAAPATLAPLLDVIAEHARERLFKGG